MEATLIIFMVLGVIAFVIYLMFFQYNRCLAEQDLGVLLLRSNTMQMQDKEELILRLKREEAQIYREKYIAWENREAVWELKGNKVRVAQWGAMKIPFGEAMGVPGQAFGQADAQYEYEYVSPIRFLRACRKISNEIKHQ